VPICKTPALKRARKQVLKPLQLTDLSVTLGVAKRLNHKKVKSSSPQKVAFSIPAQTVLQTPLPVLCLPASTKMGNTKRVLEPRSLNLLPSRRSHNGTKIIGGLSIEGEAGGRPDNAVFTKGK
jgi:hypothetical protein